MAHPIINAVVVICFSSFMFWTLLFVIKGVGISTNCNTDHTTLSIRIAMFAVTVLGSLAGLTGAYHRVSWLVGIHLFNALLLILLLIFSSISDFLPAKDHLNWDGRVQCLQNQKVCNSNYHAKLTSTQSGCCNPPTSCGFVQQNETVWINPKNTSDFSDTDCRAWNNNHNTLCYNCNSCKFGYLARKQKILKEHAFVEMALLVFPVITMFVGWHALKIIRTENEIKAFMNDPLHPLFTETV